MSGMVQQRRPRLRPPERGGFDKKRFDPAPVDLKTTATYLIAMVARLQTQIYSARTADLGVSLAGAYLLLELNQEEPLSHSELTVRLSIAHTTVAQTLKRLERGGFIERSVNGTDKRQVDVRLTETGRAICAPLKAAGDVLLEEYDRVLGSDRAEQMREWLAMLAEQLKSRQG